MTEHIRTAVSDSLDQLQRQFNNYGDPHDAFVWRGRHVSDITNEFIDRYLCGAIQHPNDVPLFKRLLPRMMYECAAAAPRICMELVYKNLKGAGFDAWPRPEQAIIDECATRTWAAYLTSMPELELCLLKGVPVDRWEGGYFFIEEIAGEAILPADDWLASFAQLDRKSDTFLTIWRNDKSLSANCHLACLIMSNARTLSRGRGPGPSNPFWENARSQQEQLRKWLLSNEQLNRLEQAQERMKDVSDDLPSLFEKAVEVVNCGMRRCRSN